MYEKGNQATPTALTLQAPKYRKWSPWLFAVFISGFMAWIGTLGVIISWHQGAVSQIFYELIIKIFLFLYS